MLGDYNRYFPQPEPFDWLRILLRMGGSISEPRSVEREAASRLKREQARKQRAKMKAHNKRQKKLNKQHGRRE